MSKKEKKYGVNDDFIDYVKSAASLLYITTNDEARTIEDIRKCVSSLNLDESQGDKKRTFGFYEWSATKGVLQGNLEEKEEEYHYHNLLDNKVEKKSYTMEETPEKEDSLNIMAALDAFSKNAPPHQRHNFDCHVAIFKDINPFFKDPRVIRKIKDIVMMNEEDGCLVRRCIVFLTTTKQIPHDLSNLLSVIEWKLPTSEEILDFIKDKQQYITEVVPDNKKKKGASSGFKSEYTRSEVDQIVTSLTGLSLPEIDNACSFSQMRYDEIDSKFLMEQKKQIILKSGLLEYYEPDEGMDEIGGMDCLKEWISIRKKAFSKEARDFGVETPKGVTLVGIQGCGKSAMCKAIAKVLDMPLLRFDVGKVFSKTVGSSEENIRNVLTLIETISPCVVMIDEIEKGLAGVGSSNESDGGTTARVVGTLLSWLNDKTCPAFVVATANNIKQLPPELTRKGRFDEIFFVPLPEEEERKEIFSIHLAKRKRKPSDFNVDAFAKLSDKFSGAECEEAIKSALILAFDEGSELKDNHVVKSIYDLIPLWKTCQEDLKYLYNWVDWDEDKEDGVRARFASTARKQVSKEAGANIIKFGEEEIKSKEKK